MTNDEVALRSRSSAEYVTSTHQEERTTVLLQRLEHLHATPTVGAPMNAAHGSTRNVIKVRNHMHTHLSITYPPNTNHTLLPPCLCTNF